MPKQDANAHATESEKVASIEVEDPYSPLSSSIKKMIREIPPMSPDYSIFRAPKLFQQLNEKAFNPLVVSLGPFHHGREELQSMEKLKVAYLNAFLTRTNISLDTCIKVMKEWEDKVRNCYAETIEFSSDDFVKMILLDSCFVIEVIWRSVNINYREKVTDHLSRPMNLVHLQLDMILLENQLPFFVLQGLVDLASPNTFSTNWDFIYGCIRYLSNHLLNRNAMLAMENISRQQPSDIKHLLDLLRMCQAPSIPRENPEGPDLEFSMRKATELDEAGMVIKPGLDYCSGIDIRYTTGILEIPKLILQSTSERLLRNLIALEWCLYYHDSYISHYIHFMDNLVDTSKDVELLIRNGIVDSFSSDSHGVATLFNNLRPYCLIPNYFYYGIQGKVNAYCKVPRHKWRATLRRDYCSSPWMIASTTAAIILLILTFIQTVFSIL